MSYSYSGHLVQGYSTGEDVFGLPRAPSASLLTDLYGGKPVGKPWKGKFDGDTPTIITLPGELQGRPLSDGTYAVDGMIGPIPASAVGKTYIAQRDGQLPIHRLVPKTQL